MANLHSWILWLHTILMGPSQLQSIERWHMRTNILISNPTTSWPKRLQYLEHSVLGLSHCAHKLCCRPGPGSEPCDEGSEVEWVSQECYRNEPAPKTTGKQRNGVVYRIFCADSDMTFDGQTGHTLKIHRKKTTFKSPVECRSPDFSPGRTWTDLSQWHCMERTRGFGF